MRQNYHQLIWSTDAMHGGLLKGKWIFNQEQSYKERNQSKSFPYNLGD